MSLCVDRRLHGRLCTSPSRFSRLQNISTFLYVDYTRSIYLLGKVGSHTEPSLRVTSQCVRRGRPAIGAATDRPLRVMDKVMDRVRDRDRRWVMADL